MTSSERAQETATATDRILDALDMAADDADRRKEADYQPNLLLMGLSGEAHVLATVAGIRANDLEAALTMLPFTDALRVLEMVPQWLHDTSKVELSVRVAVLLLKAHQAKLMATPAMRPTLAALQASLRARVQAFKNVMGFNLAGLQHLAAKAKAVAADGALTLPEKRKAAGM